MADTATKRPRTLPTPLGEFNGELPKVERTGFWKEQIETVLKPNPGKVYQYGNVSPTTASNLRKDHGLDAVSQTQADGTVTLFVKYDPERVEEIKRAVAERGAKRRATMAANKAKNAGKQTAGSRS